MKKGTPSTEKQKRSVGGSAAERGLDFQARVSAIVMANLLVERAMGWLGDILNDTPLELDAETGGPGDDIRFVVKGGKHVEVQVKRGLQRGDDLWDALLSLAKGITQGQINAGVLAVCPNSSGTIKELLSEDIVRLGGGRSDGLREIGRDFAARLDAASLDSGLVCGRIRVVVINAVDGNQEAEAGASERLSRILQNPQDAWRVLVDYGRRLIRIRGKSTPEQIYRELYLANISLKLSLVETRIQLQNAIQQWIHNTYDKLSILGVNGRIPFEGCWISLDARLLKEGLTEQEDLDKALKKYHDYANRHRGSDLAFGSHTIGRFVKKCVVLGGPGIGKSTLLKKLALDYSKNGFLTLFVKLPLVVALVLREGRRFENSILEVALSGSGLRASDVSLDGAIILCDGLDECGSQQPIVTAALHAFSVAHPNARIIVSSRPIGYRPGEISDWRHYELQPLADTEVEEVILRILLQLPFPDEPSKHRAIVRAKQHIQTQSIKGAASRSPFMLTLMAALCAKGVDPDSGKAALYRQLFKLIEDHPPARLAENPPSEPERSRFLELLGWALLAHGNEDAEQTLKRCAQSWSAEMGATFLASEARVSACCNYWEGLGVIERVRTLTQEAITFVHKTFGEFAAARYIALSNGENKYALIARAIQMPEWKETLSFASHLGMAQSILEVWAELAIAGEGKAGSTLDDAVELVVQAGVPIAEEAIAYFTECCWKIVAINTSRARYAAGEALCVVAKKHWLQIRDDVLARLEDEDRWVKLVAWACVSVSPDQDVAYSDIIDTLRSINDLIPSDPNFGGFRSGPTANPVRDHLILGGVQRILLRGPEAEEIEVLRGLLDYAGSMSFYRAIELTTLIKKFGLEETFPIQKEWDKNLDWFIHDETWRCETAYLCEIIDDPSVEIEDDGIADNISNCWELGALLTETGYLQLSLSDCLSISSGEGASQKRIVMHGIAAAAGLDRNRLIAQARYCRNQTLGNAPSERLALFELPQVDIDVQFEVPAVAVEQIDELERVIRDGGEYFSANAAKLLYSLHSSPEYPQAIKRLLAKDQSKSLRICVVLADTLPEPIGQSLILERLSNGEITQDCCYLYEHLKPPFDARHINVVYRGLEGGSASAAKAAANFAEKLHFTAEIAVQLRVYFDQWITKEKPYPKNGGTVPDSPRDMLAKLIASHFVNDNDFLIRLAKDDRPGVRAAVREAIISAAASSLQIREWLISETESHGLELGLLRTAIAAGIYSAAEAQKLIQLLQSGSVRVRYAVLPILDEKYLPIEIIRSESMRLLSDANLDIREAVNKILNKLEKTTGRPY